jgi:hypothetical protein
MRTRKSGLEIPPHAFAVEGENSRQKRRLRTLHSPDQKQREHVTELPRSRPTPPDCCRYPLSFVARRSGVKIRFVAHVVLDRSFKKIRRADTMIFARNSGRSSGGHKQKTQQSTKYSFQYTSWPRDFEMLEGLSCCGSRSSTCCPRGIL